MCSLLDINVQKMVMQTPGPLHGHFIPSKRLARVAGFVSESYEMDFRTKEKHQIFSSAHDLQNNIIPKGEAIDPVLPYPVINPVAIFISDLLRARYVALKINVQKMEVQTPGRLHGHFIPLKKVARVAGSVSESCDMVFRTKAVQQSAKNVLNKHYPFSSSPNLQIWKT